MTDSLRANVMRKATSHVLKEVERRVNQSSDQGSRGDKCGNSLWYFLALTCDSLEISLDFLGNQIPGFPWKSNFLGKKEKFILLSSQLEKR